MSPRNGQEPISLRREFPSGSAGETCHPFSTDRSGQGRKDVAPYMGNILTYFRDRRTNATVEVLNNKIQMVKEMACGFSSHQHYKLAIYFHCGGLYLYPSLEEVPS